MNKLTTLFLLALLSLTAGAQDWPIGHTRINGIYYSIYNEPGEAKVIKDYDNKYSGTVGIPSHIIYEGETYPVKEIGDEAFEDCEGLINVSIPSSVDKIGSSAFAGCTGLTSITIPSNVKTLGSYVFSGCTNLKGIHCYATEVPQTYSWYTFDGLSFYTPLFVPATSVESYKEKWDIYFRLILPLGSEPPADVVINEENFPDENFRNFLLSQDYGTDGALSFEELDQIYNLDVSNKGIQNMKGIENFFALSYLYIHQNRIKGEAMDALIEGLPVVKEGDDTHHEIYAIYNSGEGNVMTAAQVAAAKAKGWTTRAFDGYYWQEYTPSTDVAIDETNFPDENFRSWMLSETYGTDGVLTQSEARKVSQINVTEKSIKRLKGIEYFTEIVILQCSKNQIKGAAMDELVECLPSSSGNRYINVINDTNEQNVMTTTQVAAAKAKGWIPYYNAGRDGWKEYAGSEPGPEPEDVAINETNFPDANFRNFLLGQSYGADGVITVDEIANIKYFELRDMNIQSLEGIKYFTNLTSLDCAINNLDSLNVSVCPKLQYLVCFSNKITKLIASGCSKLYSLNCNTNQLTLLDVSGCTSLSVLSCFSNKLSDAAMDAFIATLPTTSNRLLNVIYYENEQNVMTTDQIAAAKAKGWTPQYYDYDAGAWKDYEGGTPTPTPTQQCAKPVINYKDGKVTFSCATEDVKFHYYCYATYRADGEGNEIEFPQPLYIRIDVYASKDGYKDSDTEIAVLPVSGTGGLRGDVNNDGTVSMPDAMFIVNKILKGKFPDEK